MTGTARLTRLHELVREVFRDEPRLTGREIQRRAGGMDISPVLRRLVDSLPDGDYGPDEANQTMARIQEQEGIWRDETRLPTSDLNRAMATSGTEGQFDDPTGHEAGPAEVFGDRDDPERATGEAVAGEAVAEEAAEGQRPRPSPEGRSGPH